MQNEEIAKNISTLIRAFNQQRVVSQAELEGVIKAVVNVLALNKKDLDEKTRQVTVQMEKALEALRSENEAVLGLIKKDFTKTQAQIEQATKDQNQRAFTRLQELLAKIRPVKDGMPGKDGKDGASGKDGKDGKDGSPDTAEQIKLKLETLKDENRLDASAIKNLPEIVEKVQKMPTGGIRFLQQLADVALSVADQRQNVILQFKSLNNRWEVGPAVTVSATEPSNPQELDVWIDAS